MIYLFQQSLISHTSTSWEASLEALSPIQNLTPSSEFVSQQYGDIVKGIFKHKHNFLIIRDTCDQERWQVGEASHWVVGSSWWWLQWWLMITMMMVATVAKIRITEVSELCFDDRIQIQILFGLKKSIILIFNNIWIPNYSLTPEG